MGVSHAMPAAKRGEVVVFRGTEAWAPEFTDDPNLSFGEKLGRTVGDLVGVARPGEKDFIKRVIGLPGDRVACCDEEGRVTVNGVSLDESAYLMDGQQASARKFDVRVPEVQVYYGRNAAACINLAIFRRFEG